RELGHVRVAVLRFTHELDVGGERELDLTVERLAGDKEGLGEAWDESLARVCRPNVPERAREAALELLGESEPPTAILAMSDTLAVGALQAAAELGVSVPADLSVVGFDDSPVAAQTTPPLTTVAQPQEEKGRLAAQWLMEEIENGERPPGWHTRAILPAQLVVPESTAPPGWPLQAPCR